ncbi:maltose/maltodextrin ABC transporter substrate-binding protein MalE [Psychromonas antarctica]|uniref:maltose/maltodextrin ABC transporter substrate-binding protein MalE n=1 Tax=Psychromonas antarctica TaxID=67573 RepID=UPI001EE7D52B|nr:maltose/maltodextrin ABC transporter substrate-binding protein MalE [Psychromonas antarctica]MCG6200628.1 maltose/maltodextrin ABC transporter substrate-binding protein MalE [Psychromonas antarctica]
MRKLSIVAISGLLAIGSLPVNAFSDNVITVWAPADKGYNGIMEIGKKFEQDTGVKVNVEHPSELENKFPQVASTGSGPDIMIFAHDRFGGYAEAGLVREVSPSNDFKSKFDSYTWSALKYKGKYFGYPISAETLSLIYNKDLMSKPMENWEDVFAIDKSMSGDKKAIIWDIQSPFFTWPILSANGGYAFKITANGFDAKDVGVNNKGANQSMAFVKKLVDQKIISSDADYANAESAFNKGEVAMTVNGPWSWKNLDKSGINYGLAVLPKLNGKPSRPFVGILTAGISTASPNSDLAKEFIENYLLTDDGLRYMNQYAPIGAPALKSFQKELSKDPRVMVTIQNAKIGDVMPNIPQMMPFWFGQKAAIGNVITGRQSIEEALATVEKRMLQ